MISRCCAATDERSGPRANHDSCLRNTCRAAWSLNTTTTHGAEPECRSESGPVNRCHRLSRREEQQDMTPSSFQVPGPRRARKPLERSNERHLGGGWDLRGSRARAMRPSSVVLLQLASRGMTPPVVDKNALPGQQRKGHGLRSHRCPRPTMAIVQPQLSRMRSSRVAESRPRKKSNVKKGDRKRQSDPTPECPTRGAGNRWKTCCSRVGSLEPSAGSPIAPPRQDTQGSRWQVPPSRRTLTLLGPDFLPGPRGWTYTIVR